jgi:Uma2 family endonuclease
MATLILPADNLKRIIRRRKTFGADRFDEVWNGVYVMSPVADIEHQQIATGLSAALLNCLSGQKDVLVLAGTNVSDRAERWRKNYRVPDVAVFLPGNSAENRGTHWFGGPDFAVEVLSPGDHSRKKLEFYATVGVRELLLIDRQSWRLDLHRLRDGRLELASRFEIASPEPIDSVVLPLSFRLHADSPRPGIEVAHRQDGRVWLV